MDLLLEICGLFVLIAFVLSFYWNPMDCEVTGKDSKTQQEPGIRVDCELCGTTVIVRGVYSKIHNKIDCPACANHMDLLEE